MRSDLELRTREERGAAGARNVSLEKNEVSY